MATACLGPLEAGARGLAAALRLPPDGCSRFGPIGAPGVERARDPDLTGGYYQPIRARYSGSDVFTLERLRCPLAQASLQLAQEYARRYVPNTNPRITSLSSSAPLEAVSAGAEVELELDWDGPSAEEFPALDLAAQSLVSQREQLTTSWLTTGGALAQAHTAAAGLSSRVRWTAPAAAGSVYIWAVLRDSRGGLAWSSLRIEVVEAPR